MAELIMTDEEKKSESFLTWSDESLGKAVKAAAFALADDTGRQSVMWTTAACLLIKKMLEADSTTLVITLEHVTLPEAVGDWRVMIQKIEQGEGAQAIRRIPQPEGGRVECGSIQFGEDWPGTFIRGDRAGWYGHLLDRVLKQLPVDLETVQLQCLARDLSGCIIGQNGNDK